MTNYMSFSALRPQDTISPGRISKNPYRTPFMSDRDRIMYCRPFLRLAGKTQVYGTGYDDHARNRLTHSLEVAQIARTIAVGLNHTLKDRLKVDENLVEAIALGHDLGHTPFGHAGERQINEILNFEHPKINELIQEYVDKFEDFKSKMQRYTGFKHNWQGLRIVSDLSRDYDRFDMELSKATISGILFHSNLKNRGESDIPQFYSSYLNKIDFMGKYVWSIEGLVVAMADEIAQRHHDIEDAISCHYLSLNKVIEILKKEIDDIERTEESKLKNEPENFSNIMDLIIPVHLAASSDLSKLAQNGETEIFLKRVLLKLDKKVVLMLKNV